MKNAGNIKNVYFIGIGGIGMSALARYYNALGCHVAGYDRTSTPLTDQLTREGIEIHFRDKLDLIPADFLNIDDTIIVYTPAVPADHSELQYFRENGFRVIKRSEVLGMIANEKRCIAVAGTHGKTTVSSMIAWIMSNSSAGCNAFLGGISKNIDSNLYLNTDSDFMIVEADEFDRSFLHLRPEFAVITAIDPDHLDIYGDLETLKKNFNHFVEGVKESGKLVLKDKLDIKTRRDIHVKNYSVNDPANYFAGNIKREGFSYSFDLFTPDGIIEDLRLGVYGKVNLENAVAAIALCDLAGIDEKTICKSIDTYRGVWRRFEVQIEEPQMIYIDDYAHHPEELKAFISSVKEAAPGKRITGIFQPHLYSRTKDFADEFAAELSSLDDVILLDIYPAREKPLPGVTSKMILGKLQNQGEKILCTKEQLFKVLKELETDVWLTMGAGDIDKLVPDIRETLLKKL